MIVLFQIKKLSLLYRLSRGIGMNDHRKTKKELIDELVASRHRIIELEAAVKPLGRRFGRRSTFRCSPGSPR